MRQVQFGDLFTMSKIAKKIGLKVDIEGTSQEAIGAEIVLQLLENLHLAEQEVVTLFADLKGVSKEEVAKLPPLELLKEFQEVNGLNLFFKQLAHLTK